MKKSIFNRPLSSAFAALVAFAALASSAQAQTLHLIAVGNPEGFIQNQNAQDDVKRDLLNVRRFFQGHVPEARLNCVSIEKEATPPVVFAEIAKLPVEPDDVVVFYYSGHAGNETEGTGQAFQLFEEIEVEEKDKTKTKLRETRLSRKDVRNKIAQRAPRLFVVLSDCCNAYMNELREKDVPVPPKSPKEVSPVAQKLFFEPSGCVDITSSKYGQYSFTGDGKTGSLATLAWIDVFEKTNETLKKNPKAEIDWRKVADSMIEETEKRFQKKYPDGAPEGGQTTQTPHVFELPGDPRLGARVQTRQHNLTVTQILEGSPAEKAGLKIDDKLLRIRYLNTDEEKTPVDETDYSQAIDFAPREIEITVEREIEKQTEKKILKVELNGLPTPQPEPDEPEEPDNTNDGDSVNNADSANNTDNANDADNIADADPWPAYDSSLPVFGATVQGQEITNVVANSRAELAGLEVGDKMLSFNGATIADGYDFEKAVDSSPLDAKVSVLKKSTNQQITVDVRLNRDPNAKPTQPSTATTRPDPNGPVFGATVQGQEITAVVANSPAALAGLEVGDKILSFNGATIRDANDYSKAVDASPLDANLVVLKKSSGAQTNVAVRLNKNASPARQTRPSQPQQPQQAQQTQQANQTQQAPNAPVFGASFEGKKITNVVPGSPAEKAGLKVGDELVNFNGETFNTAQEISNAIDNSPAEGAWGSVLRNGETVRFQIQLNK